MIDERYIRNIGSYLYKDVQELMLTKKIALIGCGGNGGYIAEFLSRFGIKELTMWDGDTYCISNLNRQIGADMNTIGQNKAEVTVKRLSQINPNIIYNTYNHFFGTDPQDFEIAIQNDLIIWAADNSGYYKQAKDLLCKVVEYGVPLLDNCVSETGGQILIITKEDLPQYIEYMGQINYTSKIAQPAYLCAMAACLTVEHVIKWFSQEQDPAVGQILSYDIKTDHMHRIDLQYGPLY